MPGNPDKMPPTLEIRSFHSKAEIRIPPYCAVLNPASSTHSPMWTPARSEDHIAVGVPDRSATLATGARSPARRRGAQTRAYSSRTTPESYGVARTARIGAGA